MDKSINTELIDSPKYFWSVPILELFLEFIDDLKESDGEEVHERSFQLFVISTNQAISEFLRDMNDLKLIMNCRTKGNSDSHFGGAECAKFMDKVVAACDEYLKNSKFLSGNNEEDLGYAIRGIKNKAKHDKAYALEFEKATKELYLSQGIDNTERIFKDAGYFDSGRPIRVVADLKKIKNILKNKVDIFLS